MMVQCKTHFSFRSRSDAHSKFSVILNVLAKDLASPVEGRFFTSTVQNDDGQSLASNNEVHHIDQKSWLRLVWFDNHVEILEELVMQDALGDWTPAAKELKAAMSEGDLDRADSLLDQLQGNQPLEILRLITDLHMRRDRWQEAADAAEKYCVAEPDSTLRGNLARNLAALRMHRPDVYKMVAHTPPAKPSPLLMAFMVEDFSREIHEFSGKDNSTTKPKN